MLQLVYISTARQPHAPEILDPLLEISRMNNAEAEVTGLLLAGGKRFLQALEGPVDAVATTYERIMADPRHHAIVLLSSRHVEERAFGKWAMGFDRNGQVDCGKGVRATTAELIDSLADKSLRAQFAGFAELHASAA
jgi:hypothetical protein